MYNKVSYSILQRFDFDDNLDSNSSSIEKSKHKKKWLKRKMNTFCQFVQLILDTPLDIPSVHVHFQMGVNDGQIEKLLTERNEKYHMLIKIGNAYTRLCFLSLVALLILMILGHVIDFISEYSRWYLPILSISAIPIAISPVYWYKKHCLKNYLLKLDDYIYILEIYSSNVISTEYKSAIIGAYLLRNHSRKLRLLMDLTPTKKKNSQKFMQ